MCDKPRGGHKSRSAASTHTVSDGNTQTAKGKTAQQAVGVGNWGRDKGEDGREGP